MKGDYTRRRRRILRLADGDHPQMKGDYTDVVHRALDGGDGDHPQMKGDYTSVIACTSATTTETTPK